MNGVNLEQFQFESDLTMMTFFQNAEGRTYTRYGGREEHDAESHLTKASLLRVMRQVLQLHKTNDVQPVNKYEPVASKVSAPEDIPPMKQMIGNRKETCIHCHDVKVARLRHLRDRGKLLKKMVFTYPSPSRLGIHLHPDRQNEIAKVDAGSIAVRLGLRAGDLINKIDGQRVLTFGDATRALELAPEKGQIVLDAQRGDKHTKLSVPLPENWRNDVDPSWRASVETVGPNAGFWGAKASNQLRRKLGVGSNELALRVTFIWGDYTKRAGVKVNDVVVSIDGQTNDMNVRQIHAHLQMNRDWGDEIPVVLRRGGKEVKATLRLPERPPH